MLPLLTLYLFTLCFGVSHLAPATPASAPCPEAAGVRALLKRLEILEKLVRDIKGQCSPPCCAGSQTGADDPSSLKPPPPCPQEIEDCPGGCGGDSRGECVDGQCQCRDGFMGDRCQLRTCPEDCHDQGRCMDGRCYCFEGYFGSDCGSKGCSNNCYDRGQCEDGVCVCDSGFSGVDCGIKTCPSDCHNRGKCEDGVCVCTSGFTGVDCGSKTCPKNCLNRGRCENGVCICRVGFTGVDCSTRLCPNNCHQRGRCEKGACICNPGFTGVDCSSATCLNNCNDHGQCQNGVCICRVGFTGVDCSTRLCPNNCNQRGRCEKGACICNPGFTGVDCSSATCLNNCNAHGQCQNGVCICDPGFSGEDCILQTCPEDCNEQGQCVRGRCVCDAGFVGVDCGIRVCSEECDRHGRCEDGECVCDPGYTGTDCEIRSCPDDCNNRGRCDDGNCVCDSGFTGPDCGSRTCPNNCHNRGRCEDGTCICNTGFSGADCGSKMCPKNCNGNGQCVNGKCVCDAGFSGPVCGTRSCPPGCAIHGRCVRGNCICSPGFTGPDCGTKTCPKNCLDRGHCEDGICICNPGYTGQDCALRTCSNNCHNRGQCDDGTCICDDGYTGTDCGSRSCPNDCHNRGKCEDGTCICNPGFTGVDCGLKTCPDDCHNRGRCEDGVCVCDSGFTGDFCQFKSCPNNCHQRGRCEDGECVCNSGYTDIDCGSRSCPSDCHHHGRCDDGECSCDSGYGGSDCGSRTCPNDCNDRGRCDDGLCVCDPGYTGHDCGSKTCPDDCNKRGQCDDGVCLCDPSYTGLDCGSRSCPNHCHNGGRCEDGTCVCDSGFSGPDCSTKACPDNCHIHGRCEDGVCICRPGFAGPDCGSKACPKNCNDNGQCVNGKCVCNPGFSGPVCGGRNCLNNCQGHGKCVNGICVCKKGYRGADCGEEVTEITVVTGFQVTEITVVTGFQVTSQGESSITLLWDQPETLPDSYEITFKAKKENGVIQNTVEGSLTTYHQTGLAPGEEYNVTIQPRKDQTLGPESTITASTKIETPHGLRVTDISTSSFLLRWDRPQSLPDRYIVILVTPSGKERKLKVPGKGDRVRLTGLEEGTRYRVILKAERGQEQSEGLETNVTTAFEKGRDRLDVVDELGVQGPEVTSQKVNRPGKPISLQDKKQRPSPSPTTTVSPTEVGEGGVKTAERKEFTTDDQLQKRGKIIQTMTTRTHTITTIINRYTIYHANGSVSVHEEVEEIDDKDPQSRPMNGQDQDVITSLIDEEDLDDETLNRLREKVPGSKVVGWVVTRNITHIQSPQNIYPDSQHPDMEKGSTWVTSHTSTEERLVGVQSSKENLKDDGVKAPVPKEITSQRQLHPSRSQTHPDSPNEPRLPVENKYDIGQSGVEGQIDDGGDDPKGRNKSKQSTKNIHRVVSVLTKEREGHGLGETRNETKRPGVADKIGPGPKHKNQTKKTPILVGSSIKSVIENLPEKLSPFNGTFIQRLESYLRATSYPLKVNQTVESVAKAIFLYLVKWKPHNFTGMVYDRLPQKTPGATGNPEPAGVSRMQGNIGRLVLENNIEMPGNVTERIHQTSDLVAKGKKIKSPEDDHPIIDRKTLGRVEALGDGDTPVILNVHTESSSEGEEDVQRKITSEEQDRETTVDNGSKSVSPKPPLENKHSKGPDSDVPRLQNVTLTQKKPKNKKDSDLKGEIKKTIIHVSETSERPSKTHDEDSTQIFSSHQNIMVEELHESKEILEDRRDHVPIRDPNVHQKILPQKQGAGKDEPTGKDDEQRSINIIDGGLSVSETNEKISQYEETEEPKKEKDTMEEQEEKEPVKSPFSVKLPGTGRPGRPTILQRNSTSLVISLEGLGVLWDKVMILYHPLPSSARIPPHKLEVERGATEVEIEGLEPGTNYRFVLHGIAKGRSSKSFSLVAETAMAATTAQPETTTQPTTPEPAEILISTTPQATQKPRGLVAQMGSLQVQDVTSDTVTLIWKARPGVYESFMIRYEDVTESTNPAETSVPGDQREVTLTHLTENTRYAVSVYGVRSGKLSRPLKVEVTTESAPDRGTTPRLSPLSVSEIRPDSFLVSWIPLDGDFDSYMIQYGPPEGPIEEVTLQGDQTFYRLIGLIAEVNYTVEIRGMWGEKYSEPETIYVFTEKPQPPVMESLTVSEVKSDSVLLSWEVEGGEFESFLLYYRDGEGNPQEIPLEGSLRTFTVNNLKPGKKYKFVLYGIHEEKRSKPVTAETITEKPLPPRLESFSASDVHSESVRLDWEVQGGEFDSFVLYYRDAEGKPRELLLESHLRVYEVEDLKPGKKYKFVLHGVSGGKKGKGMIVETTTAPRSKPLDPTPAPAPQPAPRLVDLQASEVGKDSVKLSWTVEGTVQFDWIVVQYREPEGGVRELQVPGQDISVDISGLLPSRKYKFNVYGLRGEKRSKPLSTEIETGYPEVIGPPSSLLDDLYISPRGPHALYVSWEAPDSSFESFVVRYSLPDLETPLDEVQTDGSARSLLISDLQPDTVYHITLHGIRRGKEQGHLEATGKTAPPGLEPPRNLRFDGIAETSVIAIWDSPNVETTTFKVSYQLADGGEPESVNVVGTNTLLKGLTPGAQYEVTVVSVRGFEESQPLSGYVITGGGGPRSLRVFDVTEVSALLRWDPPLGHTDKYIVTYKAENVPAITMEVSGDRTEYLLSSLYPHTQYFVSVQSVRGSETSQPTSTSFTTSANTPQDLSASQITARSALLTWKAPPTIPDGYLLIYQTPDGNTKEMSLPHNITSYIMSQLDPLTQYRVQLHAIHGGSRSMPISTSFTTVRLKFQFPRDCWEQRMNGEVLTGIFNIHLEGAREETMPVYCDMETDGGGWIVFQRRLDGSIDFYKDWNNYKKGFGNLTSEFWLGNIALHKLSSATPSELRVDLHAGDEAAYAVYDDFHVDSEEQNFRLRLGAYRGNAGDSMSYHNNMIFSTRDRDAQKRILPCAVSYHGAWWYRNCHFANLNGLYNNNKDHQGMNWHTWKGFEFSIPFTEMKMRPRGGGNRNRL